MNTALERRERKSWNFVVSCCRRSLWSTPSLVRIRTHLVHFLKSRRQIFSMKSIKSSKLIINGLQRRKGVWARVGMWWRDVVGEARGLNYNFFEAHDTTMQYLDIIRKNLHFTSFLMQFFRFTIAFSVEKIYRFFMFLLAGYTLYYRGI